jgi:hypothetical protein
MLFHFCKNEIVSLLQKAPLRAALRALRAALQTAIAGARTSIARPMMASPASD